MQKYTAITDPECYLPKYCYHQPCCRYLSSMVVRYEETWCNSLGKYIQQPTRELAMGYSQNPETHSDHVFTEIRNVLTQILLSSMVRHAGKRGGNTYDNIHRSDLLRVLNHGRTKGVMLQEMGRYIQESLPHGFNMVRRRTIRVVTTMDVRP